MYASFFPNTGNCKCTNYVSNNGYGNCSKDYGDKGPLCYVEEPSTCPDVVNSQSEKGKRFSYEACTNGSSGKFELPASYFSTLLK